MRILLMFIGTYSIKAIGAYFYLCLLAPILLMAIGAYWCLFYLCLLAPILLMAIGGYSITGYWLLFY